MTLKYGPLGMRVDDRYRNIPEARIIEMLMHTPVYTDTVRVTG